MVKKKILDEILRKSYVKGKVEGEMALLSEGTSVKESSEDKQASVPCVRGSTFMWGAHIFCKIRASAGFSGGSEYSVTPVKISSLSCSF